MRPPLHSHHEAHHPRRTQETPDIVHFAQDLLLIDLPILRRVVVHEQHQHEADEIPESDGDADVAPVAGLGNELGPEDRGAKGQDSEDDEADVGATLAHGHELGGAGEGDEFVEARAKARKDHTACKEQCVSIGSHVASCRHLGSLPIAGLIDLAVAVMIGPRIRRPCPAAATGFRPTRSESAPTKGHNAALGMR